MKQIVSIVALLMICISVSSQTVKGSKAIGGGISYSKSTYTGSDGEDVDASDFSFAPSFGYFVADNIVVGGNIELVSTKNVGYPFGETKGTGFAFGPFARYYMHSSNEQFAFFGQASFMFGSLKETYEAIDEDTKGSSFEFYVSPGFAYFFNEHWALELGFRGIGFSSVDPDKDQDDDEIKSMTIGLNSLSPSSIGIRYHF